MKPVLTDRMAVIGILAGLVLWACCLTVLWGWAYDSAGSFSLMTFLALLLVHWLFLWRRQRAARWALRMLGWVHLRKWAPLEDTLKHTLGSTKEDARMRMRLLSTSAVVAVVGFVLATLCIPAARLGAALLGQWFLFDDFTWRGLECFTLLLGVLPVAAGFVSVLYASTVVRATGGRDTFASAYRDWLWGLGLGFAAFAVSWWFGANLIYLVFAVGGLILLTALTAVSRMDLSTHPRKALLPFGPPSRWAPWQIAAAHAVLALVLLVQVRLLGDLFGLSLTRRLLWVFLSLVLLAFFLSRIDRKGRSPGAKQISGVLLGVAAALLAQTAEILLGGSIDTGRGWMLLFAVATQIPVAALAATLFSHQRRSFAQAGGSVGAYMTAASGGLCLAVLAYLLMGSISAGWVALPVLAGLMILGGGVDGARHCRGWSQRAQWLGWAGGLCVTMLLAFGAALQETGAERRSAQPGSWLTSLGQRNRALQRYRQHGLLPGRHVPRSKIVTQCLYEIRRKNGKKHESGIFALRRGRWWIVSTAAEDLPPTLPGRFYAAGANPEPPYQPKRYKRWPPLSYSHPNFFRYARLNFNANLGCDYYDGILLAPLPADHPQAWRCYNETVLRRCKRLAEMRNPDGSIAMGVIALRTQVGADHVRRALAVARTFHQAVRSGWALVAIQRHGLDMLLFGPNEALAGEYKKADGDEESKMLLEDVPSALAEKLRYVHDDVYLVPIEELWEVYSDVTPVRLANPPGERLAGTPKLEGLRNYLETKRRILRLEQGEKDKSYANPPRRPWAESR